MEERRFDDLTRTLARGQSRRGVMRALGGSALAGLAALLGRNRTDAAVCRQGGATCLKDAQCCSGDCDSDSHLCTCVSGTLCRGRCVDTSMDPDNCGGCGIVCASGSCFEGYCFPNSSLVPGSPAEVWRVLTDRSAIAAWAFANDFAPRVGHRFTLRTRPRAGFDGVMQGQVAAVEAPHRRTFTWHSGDLTEPVTVTLTLDPIADGTQTRVSLAHDGGPAACRAAGLLLGRDWFHRLLGEALSRHLTAGK